MLILRIIRYIRGTVEFELYGSFPQRAVNYCKNKNIPVWEIVPDRNFYTAKTYKRSYKEISKLDDGKNIKVKALKGSGLPFDLFFLLRRPGIIWGFIAGAFLLFYLTSHIWIININSDNNEAKEKLYASLNSMGVYEGCRKSSVDPKLMSKKLMVSNDYLAWDSLNLKGCTLTLEISEKKEAPPSKYNKNLHGDIVAGEDGQIVYMEVRKGQKIKNTGETVGKGDIIVRGTMVDKFGEITVVNADAVVEALCVKEIRCAVPMKEFINMPCGKAKKSVSFYTKDKEFDIIYNKNNSCVKTEEKLYSLPFLKNTGFKISAYQPVKLAGCELSEEEALKKALRLLERETEKVNAKKIISKVINKELKENFIQVNAKITFIKNIAENRYF